eukprot:1407872-Alexandrium_andersonii.AAC.1
MAQFTRGNRLAASAVRRPRTDCTFFLAARAGVAPEDAVPVLAGSITGVPHQRVMTWALDHHNSVYPSERLQIVHR